MQSSTTRLSRVNSFTSASLRLVRPARGPLAPLFQRGNSSSATVSGSSPLLRRRLKEDCSKAPSPQLKVKETKASN